MTTPKPYRIAVVDFETTGLGDDAQVCESGCSVIEKVGDVWTIAHEPLSRLHKITCDMPPEARAIHHISKQMCDEAMTAYEPVVAIHTAVDAYAAFNIGFDGRFLPEGPKHLCVYKAALRCWPNCPEHKNWTVAYWLQDQGLIEPFDKAKTSLPHRAGSDVTVTTAILLCMLNSGTTGSQISAWTSQPALLPRCPIGDHRGKPWAEVPSGFLNWMVGRDGMEEDLKFNARRELELRAAS